MSRIAALIVAAGRGTRAAAAISDAIPAKQYATIAGRTVLERTVAAFLTHPAVGSVTVVIHPADAEVYARALATHAKKPGLLPPVTGGVTRQKSVAAGLKSLAALPEPPGAVLIHDAARPFVTAGTIDRVLSALAANPGVVAAVQVADTLKRTDTSGTVIGTIDRANVWLAQTPQAFEFSAILAAHQAATAAGHTDFTDDAAVFEWHGQPVKIVPGDAINSKLTMPEDFVMAEKMFASAPMPDVRVGTGFDVHKFTAGNHVWLCGVNIPHNQGVEAHSDGDVGLHALTDALLGAIGDGDIGLHFKNTDPRWRGASSDQFLADAARRVAAANGRITSVDVTLLCEAPKIGPHRDAMRARVAEILQIDLSRVGIKATTTEQLGFAGRREGLAAMATATVVFP